MHIQAQYNTITFKYNTTVIAKQMEYKHKYEFNTMQIHTNSRTTKYNTIRPNTNTNIILTANNIIQMQYKCNTNTVEYDTNTTPCDYNTIQKYEIQYKYKYNSNTTTNTNTKQCKCTQIEYEYNRMQIQ